MKTHITEYLGHVEVILPALIAEGLTANDRAKVRMSALQAVVQRAQSLGAEPPELTAECRAAGIDSTMIRSLLLGARAAGNGVTTAPGLSQLTDDLWKDVEIMIHAVQAGDAPAGIAADGRLSAIRAQVEIGNDEIREAQVAKLTAVPGPEDDSLHRLVMDLHKALNRLAAACAQEIVAGASVYGLRPDDKPVIQAFMRGLERTRGLKFDHPGLDTMAARRGSRLVVENDIGTTDAHVLIVAIEGATVTVTHTDVHKARAKFFTALFDQFPVQWSGLDHGQGDELGGQAFCLITGRYDAETSERRDAFLEALGAALVFLIDWNKARKVLRTLVDNAEAVRILDWAARREIGHRGFLELGGSELVASAVRHATPARIGFGERLSDALGRGEAVDFLKAVLRISTEALRENRSLRVARDEIEAELLRRFERTDSTLLAVVVRQAGLAREIAAGIAHRVAPQPSGFLQDGSRLAARARRIEEKADRLVVETRNAIARFAAAPTIGRLVNSLEGAIDELEQAAFIASLLPACLEPAILQPLADLTAAAVADAEAIAAGIDATAEIPEGQRTDFEDALAATRRVADLEHAADQAERAVTALVFRSEWDVKSALSVLELARSLERACDGFAAAGNLLHEHFMADLSA